MNHRSKIRIVLSVMILGLLLFAACTAGAENAELTLEEIPLFGEDLSGYEMMLTDAYLETAPGADSMEGLTLLREAGERRYYAVSEELMRSLKEAYATGGLTLADISPDGSSMLFFMNDSVAALRNKMIIPGFPAAVGRGAPDTYGTLNKYLTTRAGNHLGTDGVAWSPDGRYAVMINSWKRGLVTGNMPLCQLFIMDLERGETFLAADWAIKPIDESSGMALYPRFDRSGRYIYFHARGGVAKYANALMRYDMESGQMEMLYDENWLEMLRPWLWETKDGSWLCAQSAIGDRSNPGVIYTYTPTGEGWTGHISALSLPCKMFDIRQLQYLENAGTGGFLAAVALVANDTAFTVLPMEELAGPEEDVRMLQPVYYCFPADGDSLTLRSFSTEEEVKQIFAGRVDDGSPSPMRRISCSAVSPDGRFLLLGVGTATEGARLILLDPETLDFRTVEIPEEVRDKVVYYDTTLSGYDPGLRWCGDGRLLMETTKGVRMYRILGQ